MNVKLVFEALTERLKQLDKEDYQCHVELVKHGDGRIEIKITRGNEC